MKKFAYALLVAGFLSASLSSSANAGVTVLVSQNGSDVVATASGSLNLTGLTVFGTNLEDGSLGQVDGSQSFIQIGATPNADLYKTITGPSQFGTSTPFYWSSSATGDVFAIDKYAIFVPTGYLSGSSINGSAIWLNQSLTTLGLTPGVYIYALPNDTITLDIGDPDALPEPSTWALMLLGFGAIGAAMRRMRKANTLPQLA